MWSFGKYSKYLWCLNLYLGCILAELLTGYPLLPGEDESDQLACMIELLGMPPQVWLIFLLRNDNVIIFSD